MKKYASLFVAVLICNTIIAQTMPETDVWLAEVRINNSGVYFGSASNITSRKGYDNQPAFFNDSILLYTSIRADNQADIYTYHLKSKQINRLTNYTESEYSPKPTFDCKSISTVVVEQDSAQRLWSYAPNGKVHQQVNKAIDSVGYYTWLSDTSFAAFILTEPSSLQQFSTLHAKNKVLATNIGRSMQMSADGFLYFTQLEKDSVRWLCRIEKDGTTTKLIEFYKGVEDFVLSKNNTVFCAKEGFIYFCDNRFDKGWRVCGNFSSKGANNITRLALSPNEKLFSFVNLEP